MTQLLRNQLEACEQSYLEREREIEQDPFALTELIEISLSLLQAIRRMDEMYHIKVRQKQMPLDRSTVQNIHRLYESWYGFAPQILRRIQETEGRGAIIENAEQFRRESRTTHLPGFEPERLEAAERDFAEGRFYTLDEVRDELRRRAGK